MSKTTEPQPTIDEGSRAFGATLTQIDDGCLHAECTDELHALLKDLDSHAGKYQRDAKGKLTIVLDFKVSPQGTVTVVGDVKKKSPPAPRATSVFWLTKGRNLSGENPRQQKLPLRDVSASPPPRDLEATNEAPPKKI